MTDFRDRLHIQRETRAALAAIRAKHRAALADVLARESKNETLPFRAREFRDALALDFRAQLERLYRLRELTPARKNIDLALYPQPFGPNLRAARIGDDRVVLLDPSERMADDLLTLHLAGESVGAALALDYLRIGDDLAGAPSPAGIPAVDLKWRSNV